MRFSASITLSLLPLVNAGWREDCGASGNAQFHIIRDAPYLSTLCPSSTGRLICTMLDLSYCLMNSLGHLVPTINGNFNRSCKDCELTGPNATVLSCSCQMFGRNAPWVAAEVDLEEVVFNKDGFLTCWDSQPLTCPGFE
ncbi:Cyanovirin-N [Xylaria intraflava]|nr:Cyanovirin-N [Xylaria intraflava]